MIRSNISKGRGDEFYTRPEDVARILSPMLGSLAGRRVMCPCDGRESAWVQFLMDHGVAVDWSTGDFDAVDFDAYDVIVTNPPFSRLADFVRKAMASTADFVIVLPHSAAASEVPVQAMVDRGAEMIPGPRQFVRPSGKLRQVGTSVLSTLPTGYERPTPRRADDVHDRTADGRLVYDRAAAVPDRWEGVALVPASFLWTRYDAGLHELVGSEHAAVGVGDGRRRFCRVAVRCVGRHDGQVDGTTGESVDPTGDTTAEGGVGMQPS
jgi:hypothetical protein